jgi:hypothetical protein
MSSAETVGPDEFRNALAPLVTFLREFTGAIHAVGERHGRNPWAESPATKELADDADYGARCGWDGPITNTHAMGGLTLTAATDYVRSFAEVLAADRPPTYGHLVLARAALESSVVCVWLNEDGIARDERVKRGLSEYIYAVVEEERLGLQDDTTVVVDLIAHAAALGWGVTDRNDKTWTHKSRGNPKIDGVSRPSTGPAITRLLVDNAQAKIGKMEWSRLSAVTHVTFFGLRWAFMGHSSSSGYVASTHVGTDLHAVYLQAFCIIKALRQAATARFALMGWADDEWHGIVSNAVQHEIALVQAYTTGSARAEDDADAS